MIHFQTKLATFCMQAYIAFFTHGLVCFCSFYNVLEKLVFTSDSFHQISRPVEVQLLCLVYFGVLPLFLASKKLPVSKTPGEILFAGQVGNTFSMLQ